MSIIKNLREKIGSKSAKIETSLKNNIDQELAVPPKKQPIKKVVFIIIAVIVSIFALSELVFGVMIYGLKVENKATKLAVKIIPLPAAYTSSGVITMADFYHEKDYINHFYSSTKQDSGVDQKELSKQILNQLEENKIINNEAIKLKIKINKQETDDAVNKILEANGGQEKVEQTLNELYGLSLEQFKELVNTQLIRDKINNEAIEKVTIRHILIRVDQDAAEDKVNEAKAKIDGILTEIKGGLSFEDAAKKYSEDVGSNEQGGLLDPFSRSEMVKEFEDVAFSQPLMEVSEPFRTSFGYHILVVEKKTGYIHSSFDQWLSDLKNKSIILNFYQPKK